MYRTAQVEEWESRAKEVLVESGKPPRDPREEIEPQYTTLAALDALLAEGDDIEAALPSYHALQTAVSHARDWLAKVGHPLLLHRRSQKSLS